MSWLDSTVHRAVVEAVLVGALGGVVGVFVIARRLPFFTMALTHATFPGIVVAAMLGVNLYLGGGLFGLLVVAAVLAFGRARGQDFTTATGIALSGGFALGVVLVSSQDGFTKDLAAYTVGDVLAVGTGDLVATGVVVVAVSLLLALLGKELLLTAFDPVGAAALGLPTLLLDFALLAAVEVTVVATVPALGTILAVALIVGPAATARLITDRLAPLFPIAAAIGVACALAGVWVSTLWNVATGASIALFVGLVFGVVFLGTAVRGRVRRATAANPA
ncbi:anchored repeat-type ABC transporter permease subunit [Microbispora rosea subsp. aerata]|nr:metal ABC transporter permease [Microbispora rosea]GGO17699.1 anchored repeat-type ABC transporter permease subunit [Microbispora rosea subsp. aerata]GIH56589.1 anchored repeat-type ABC transporter permease subunit [Microbispora rosea subsp. aerata]GLJ81882.1 anchored repeat-type ABC transporter permease subunit [Microbispora rosea subsp. aerata]